MSGIMNMFVAAKTTIATAVDAFFNLTTLLLNTTATNGAQNNTFLDSSTNNFTITRNGNTTQGTFTPFSQTGWSNFFGSSNFLTTPSSSAFNLSSGDWTIEGWFWLNTNTDDTRLFTIVNSSSDMYGAFVRSGTVRFGQIGVGDAAFGTVNLNTWNHIAFSKTSTSTVTCYINGVSTGSTTSYTLPNANCTAYIVASPANFALATTNGYVSNFRIVKGTAVYTGAFTPSTTPLTAITNTSLLTCQSNRFIDNSSNGFAITVNGTPSVQAFSPFAPTAAYDTAVVGGSGYFDGTGDYLNGPNASGGDFSTGNLTIACWFYPTVLTGGNDYGLMSYADTGGWNGWQLLARATTKDIKFEFLTGSASGGAMTGGSIALNAWNYVVITRSGSTVNLYVNSTSVVATMTNSSAYGVAGSRVLVGGDRLLGTLFNGYISNAKLVKQANAPASIPTAPDTNTTNTSFLLNYTNAGIYDSTAKNVLETAGNAQASTTQAKWGTTSMYFDGSGDYLVAPQLPINSLGSGNFTIEGWFYCTGYNGGAAIYSGINTYPSSAGLLFYLNGSGTYTVDVGGSNVFSTGTAPLNTWTYFALTRSGSTITLYINGSSVATGTSSTNFTSQYLTIGRTGAGAASNYYLGYLDDIRITNGYARTITASPTAAFPLQ